MKYAIEQLWSDRAAYEIVREVSDKTIEIRKMKQDFKWENDYGSEQIWHFASCPDCQTMRIRKNKKGHWVSKGRKFFLSSKPEAYYDPHF
jgi:hypothetical protein